MSRLVTVSNRVCQPPNDPPPGGVAAGLLSATHTGLWFGWNGQTSVNAGMQSPVIARRDELTYASIAFEPTEYKDFYLGFCTSTLWPLLHGFTDRLEYSGTQFDAYQRTNQRYARHLLPLLRPDDLIWVHDYQLLPLAQRLREAGCRQPMGLFLHTPFPEMNVLRLLPVHSEVLRAMLAYDIVGFQTPADESAFRYAISDVWGSQALLGEHSVSVGDRYVTTGVFPVSVDADVIQEEAARGLGPDEGINNWTGQRLAIGVDRLDYTKGLVERVAAYERFLELYPENRGRVTFLQVSPLSRPEVPAYADYRRELAHAITRTNGATATSDWIPIRYLNHAVPHDRLMGLMRSAQVGVVTALRDGMNLVAKEYAAAQDPADPGVLILSAFAGAARELTSAVLVNPYDTCGVAHAVQRAFTMPLTERRNRHQEMLAVLRRHSAQAWHTSFVDALESARDRTG